ncbi:MAG: dihydroorotate dehydrogenase electron transfer subunit [Planctomycetota bacterium]|jgi:dihydroorotate dehydrogenase electron transfer subunit
MAAPPDDTRVLRVTVTDQRRTGDDAIVLRVAPKEPLGPIRAGRFFMLRREDRLSPAIPRPFSIYRQLPSGELEFLIKVMGDGTRALEASVPGTELVCIGPLGHGLPALDAEGAPWVLVGGGIGSVPFYMGIEQALLGMDGGAAVTAADMTFVYGGRTAGFLYDLDRFEALGARCWAATDDGTAGFQGNVVQLLEARFKSGELPEKVRLMACGPEPMMEAVARLAKERDLDCWLSLETLMGCGVGICNGCAVETVPGGAFGDWPVAKCCVDGPVFNARDVVLH